jgi:hypothetical protein
MSKMRGAIPPLPKYAFMACCFVKVQGQIYLLLWAKRRRINMGHVARMGEGRCVYRVLVGRREGKRPLGRPTRRWEDNIKMDLREIGIDGLNWIRLDQDRDQWRAFVNTVMNLRIP